MVSKTTATQRSNIMNKPELVYVTYIRSTPQKGWDAITQPEFTRHYWGGNANLSDWKTESGWPHVLSSLKSFLETETGLKIGWGS